MFDYLIVGAGFAGDVLVERLAREANKTVLLVDKRSPIGGNAYDTYNEDGILIHPYGPHIFHTHAPRIFEYLSRFTDWRPYEYRKREDDRKEKIVLSTSRVPISPFFVTSLPPAVLPATPARSNRGAMSRE